MRQSTVAAIGLSGLVGAALGLVAFYILDGRAALAGLGMAAASLVAFLFAVHKTEKLSDLPERVIEPCDAAEFCCAMRMACKERTIIWKQRMWDPNIGFHLCVHQHVKKHSDDCESGEAMKERVALALLPEWCLT